MRLDVILSKTPRELFAEWGYDPIFAREKNSKPYVLYDPNGWGVNERRVKEILDSPENAVFYRSKWRDVTLIAVFSNGLYVPPGKLVSTMIFPHFREEGYNYFKKAMDEYNTRS